MTRVLLGGVLVVACALLAAGAPVYAGNSPLVVNSTASAGPMTLRHAIESANSNPGPDTINFDPAVFPPGNPAIIPVDIELPMVDDTDGITIDGTGAGVIIDGSGADSGVPGLWFDAPSAPYNGGAIVLRQFTVQHFDDDGLLVFNDGNVASLTIDHLTSVDNAGAGFDLLIDGSIGMTTVTDSEFSRNGDDGLYLGPGGDMDNTGLTNVVANGNTGTGILVYPDGATTNVTVSGGTAGTNTEDGLEINGASVSSVAITGFTATGNESDGITIGGGSGLDGLTINDVNSSENGGFGLAISGQASANVEVRGNSFNGNDAGISIFAPGTTGNVIAENTIGENERDGIQVAFSFGPANQHWTLSRNSTVANGELGIDLVALTDTPPGVTPNDLGDADPGANTLLNTPEWLFAGGEYVANGTACANCLVEVFRSDGDPSGSGEGATFLADVVAGSDGRFDFTICGVSEGEFITTTATDADGNTSEFAANYEVLEDTGPCLPRIGDLDCDGDIDERDALIAFIYEAEATQLDREDGCPALGQDLGEPEPTAAGPTIFGDTNCNDAVDSGDGIAILLYLTDLEPPPNECSPIGSSYPVSG